MPLYYKDTQQIFHIHVPKTGGSSLSKLFITNNWKEHNELSIKSGNQHALKNCWEKKISEEIPKIIIFRDPVNRVISEIRGNYKYYHNIIKPFDLNVCINYIFTNDTELQREDNHFKKFVEFVDIKNINKYNIKIFLYEDPNLENNIKSYCGLNHDFPKLTGDSYKSDIKVSQLTDNSIEIIKNYYKEDYDFIKSL